MNSKFFHLVVKQWRSQYFIFHIKDDSGRWVEEKEGIKASATLYFQNLFMLKWQDRLTPHLDFPIPKLIQADNVQI